MKNFHIFILIKQLMNNSFYSKFELIKLIFSFCMIYNLFFSNSLFGNDSLGLLEWEPINDASYYQIEVRNNKKKVLISEKIKDSQFQVPNNLPNGIYEHRVGVYNKFEKLSGYSDWYSFQINTIKKPELTNNQEKTILEGTDTVHFDLKGNNFTEIMRVSLLSNESKMVYLDKYNYTNNNSISFDVKSSKLIPGNYSLILENTSDHKLNVPNFLIIKPDTRAQEEAERLRLEREKKEKEEEEKARIAREKKEKEEAEKAKIAEEKRLKEEEKARIAKEKKDKEETEKNKIAEEKKKKEEEKSKLAEEKKKKEAEKAKLAEEQKKKEAEEKAKLTEEQKKKEEEKVKLAEEKKKKEAEEKAKLTEEQKKKEEEKAKLAEEKKKKEAEEKDKLAEEQKKKEAEEAEKTRIAEEKKIKEIEANEERKKNEIANKQKERAIEKGNQSSENKQTTSKSAEEIESEPFQFEKLTPVQKSALLPGWGLKDTPKDHWRFYAYPAISLFLLNNIYTNYKSFQSNINTYNNHISYTGGSILLRSPGGFLFNQNIADNAYKNSFNAKQNMELTTLVFVGFYIYNLYSTDEITQNVSQIDIKEIKKGFDYTFQINLNSINPISNRNEKSFDIGLHYNF
jgi:hypothetical protein